MGNKSWDSGVQKEHAPERELIDEIEEGKRLQREKEAKLREEARRIEEEAKKQRGQ